MVCRLRKLVNDLRKSGKIDEKTEIHIELARSVNDKATRMAINEMQRHNEKQRKQAIDEFAEYGDGLFKIKPIFEFF